MLDAARSRTGDRLRVYSGAFSSVAEGRRPVEPAQRKSHWPAAHCVAQ